MVGSCQVCPTDGLAVVLALSMFAFAVVYDQLCVDIFDVLIGGHNMDELGYEQRVLCMHVTPPHACFDTVE